MAHSPSPGPSTLPVPHVRRQSASPPTAHQPLSKRDKRRTMIDQRLKEIAQSFSQNRDTHLRTQLNGLSRDMHFVTRVDPYQNKLLDDEPDDLSVEVASITGGGVENEKLPLGRLATAFVDQINDEIESRDAGITEADLAYRNQVAHLQLEYEFSMAVADAEKQVLRDLARQRVVTALQTKKRHIAKEKEQLDSADSTYLMNTHALTALATAPGSPGGAHANRKTRYTRNRQDPDGLTDGADVGGNGAGGINGKRKRKAGGAADLDYDSPGAGSGMGHTRGPLFNGLGNGLWEKAANKANTAAGDSDTLPTIVSADRFFTPRELALANKTAHTTVAQAWTDRRPRRAAAGSNGAEANGYPSVAGGERGGSVAPSGGDEDDEGTAQVDYTALVAPAMDRTANSSSHATRSTRLNPPASSMAAAAISAAAAAAAGSAAAAGLAGLVPGAEYSGAADVRAVTAEHALERFDDPKRIYGMAVLEALSIRPKGMGAKDLEAPLTRELSAGQIQEDLAVIQSLMDAPDD